MPVVRPGRVDCVPFAGARGVPGRTERPYREKDDVLPGRGSGRRPARGLGRRRAVRYDRDGFHDAHVVELAELAELADFTARGAGPEKGRDFRPVGGSPVNGRASGFGNSIHGQP